MKSIKFGLLILFCLAFFQTANTIYAIQEPLSDAEQEREIFVLINREREKRGLESLNWNQTLSEIARKYSAKMANENFFDHYDREGKTVEERVKAGRIRNWRMIGENLFMCQGYKKFSDIAVKGWMKSPGHRANILEQDFNQTGIGVARSNDGTIFITQIFIVN